MISLALYPIYIPEVVHPHYTLQKAFEKHFFPCYTYDWLQAKNKVGMQQAQLQFLEFLKKEKPEYTFMQLQNPDNMTVEMIREMAKHTKIIQWSGDIRQTDAWYKWFENIGREIHLTLFSNMTDVEIMRARGVKADYLQVGVDTGWYYPGASVTDEYDIVMSAHNYGNFQLSKYRLEVGMALRAEFKDRFRLFGGGWEKHGFKTVTTNCKEEADAYRSAKIGISVSNFSFKRYHSDRLLRIMACECLPLSHSYEWLDKDYEQDENIAVFHDIPALIERCHFYLDNESERKRVAHNACLKAINHCTWDSRCKELITLIEKYA